MTKKELKKLESLENKKAKLQDRFLKALEDEHRKIRNIGWGCNMRSYKTVMSLNLSKSDKIKKQIEEVEEQIKELKITA